MPDSILEDSIKICLCLMLFQCYALQFYPAIDIVEASTMPIIRARYGPKMVIVGRHVVRALLAAMTVALVGIENSNMAMEFVDGMERK